MAMRIMRMGLEGIISGHSMGRFSLESRIAAWRRAEAERLTRERRPDLI